MDGFTNFVITIEKDGKFYAFADRIRNNNDLLCFFKRWEKQGAIHVNAVKTAKEAHRIATVWNETYKENGTYDISVF